MYHHLFTGEMVHLMQRITGMIRGIRANDQGHQQHPHHEVKADASGVPRTAPMLVPSGALLGEEMPSLIDAVIIYGAYLTLYLFLFLPLFDKSIILVHRRCTQIHLPFKSR